MRFFHFFVDLTGEFTVGDYFSTDTMYVDEIDGATYQWYSDGDLLSGETNYYYVVPFDFDGVITCIITNSFGCTDTIEMEFSVWIAELNANAKGLFIYPNPASDNISFNIDCNYKTGILITNSIGEIIVKRNIGSNYNFDISNWPEGIYNCTIIQNEKVSSQQFVIQH